MKSYCRSCGKVMAKDDLVEFEEKLMLSQEKRVILLCEECVAKTSPKMGRGREEFVVKDGDGHLLLFMDKSHSYSIETSEPVKGELVADWVQDVFGDFSKGDYIPPKEAKVRVEALEGGVGRVGVLLSEELTPVLHEFAVQMEAHVGTAKGLHEGSVALVAGSEALTRAASVMEEGSRVQAANIGELVGVLRQVLTLSQGEAPKRGFLQRLVSVFL